MSETLPQPPPNAPAPPPSRTALRSRRWRNWIFGVGIVSVVLSVGFGFLLISSIGYRRGPHHRTEAVHNARQIGFALFEFETEFGGFPDSSTIGALKKKFPDATIPLGTRSSNDYFRQLLVAEVSLSEQEFYSRLPGHRKPDNRFDGAMALEKGECGFAYIAGMTTTSNPPETPIVVCPLVPGKRLFDYKFCKEYFDGKAVILRIDNSVSSLPVDKSGRVFIHGKDLFDPSQAFWNGKPPDVKWPE